jgi:hypothetical protein
MTTTLESFQFLGKKESKRQALRFLKKRLYHRKATKMEVSRDAVIARS